MALLASVLPLMAFLIIWGLAIMFIWQQRRQVRWRPFGESFLHAALIWGVCVTVFSEGLSAVQALTPSALATCWLVVDITGVGVLAGIILCLRRPSKFAPSIEIPILPSVAILGEYTSVWYISIGITAIILVVTAFTANVAPPNNWDAMTYHLARVQHWIQNQSVAFYPTNNVRQLFDPPWAEYALLQFQLLTGGDSLANFVQWFSGLGACIGASLIALQLGANRVGQGLAMVLAATTPMAILQSSSPQNDLVTSFWVVCCVYFAFSFVRQPNLIDTSAMGAALGLAILTKGTSYIFVAPVLLGLALWLTMCLYGKRKPGWSWSSLLSWACVIVALVLALNSAQFSRNAVAFHSPLGPDGAAYANQTFAPSALACNAARDISLELGTPSARLNVRLYKGVHDFCSALGISVNDVRISWTGQGGLPFRITPFNTYEGTAGNLAQSALIALALALVFMLRRLRTRPEVLLYAALLLLGYVLFVSYLRWQPWGNRLLLPWFIAAAPLVGTALDRLFARRVSIPVLELGLLLLATPFLLLNRNDPLIGSSTVFTSPRISQYFVSNVGSEKPDREAAQFVNHQGCLSIGFHSGVEGWEYPFWLLIGSKPYQAHIEHVLVDNQSTYYARDPRYQRFHPCVIISVIDPAVPEPAVVVVNGTQYQSSWSDDVVAVYLPVLPKHVGP